MSLLVRPRGSGGSVMGVGKYHGLGGVRHPPPRGGLGYEKWMGEGNMGRKYRRSTDKAKQGLD